jgi:undecaprenyl-diphosphatase
MSKAEALLLGIIQGLTEFLPVSSSGHLVIAQHYMPHFKQPGVLFDALLHFGTVMAVIIYFWKDIKILFGAIIPVRQGNNSVRIHRKMVGLIMVGTILTGLIGVTFEDYFVRLFSSVTAASLMLLVTGSILLAVGFVKESKRCEGDLNMMDAVYIGIAQGAAIIPGISRSGTTISTGIFRGIDGIVAAKFSFLLSIPAVLGAVLLECRHINMVETNEIAAYTLGTVSAFITGLLAIRFLLSAIKRHRFHIFAYYCFLAGGLSLTFATLNVF